MVWFLGIDTSAYTTSIAAVDDKGILLGEERKLLDVTQGKQGLRQSEALFQHVQNLPEVIALIRQSSNLVINDLAGIGVSAYPRPVEGSYMPVFRAGLSLAESLSYLHRIFLMKTSHQEGHLRAGIFSAEGPGVNEFLSVHLSGGTSELLKVKRLESRFEIKLLGGTTDLHAGQLVDRIGVLLGLPFPAGPALEKLADDKVQTMSVESNKLVSPLKQENVDLKNSFIRDSGVLHLPSVVKGYNFSFSGAETQARRWIESGVPPAVVAQSIQRCIANTVEKVVRRAIQETGIREVLIVGGVAANNFLRQRLRYRLEHPAVKARLYFADPRLSSDNAVGIALLAYDKWKTGGRIEKW